MKVGAGRRLGRRACLRGERDGVVFPRAREEYAGARLRDWIVSEVELRELGRLLRAAGLPFGVVSRFDDVGC